MVEVRLIPDEPVKTFLLPEWFSSPFKIEVSLPGSKAFMAFHDPIQSRSYRRQGAFQVDVVGHDAVGPDIPVFEFGLDKM